MIPHNEPQEYISSRFGTIKNYYYEMEVFEVSQLRITLKMSLKSCALLFRIL